MGPIKLIKKDQSIYQEDVDITCGPPWFDQYEIKNSSLREPSIALLSVNWLQLRTLHLYLLTHNIFIIPQEISNPPYNV